MNDDQRPIVVKRAKKSRGRGHGGAWKIAYADFVTAMMAFFLLMWLLSTAPSGSLQGIAEYFKMPLRVALSGGSASGESSSVIKGGARTIVRDDGQKDKTSHPVERRTINLQISRKELEKKELDQLKELKSTLEKKIEAVPLLKQFKKQILIDITTEGLRIQIVDEKNRPMFDLGSARLKPYTIDILHEIGNVLNHVPNRITLSGHTDATPYWSGEKSYSNWELSADRANASRRELIAGGMEESKIVRIVGLASAVMLDHNDPYNPINRRISIIVMNKETEEAITRDATPVEADKLGDAPLSGGGGSQKNAPPAVAEKGSKEHRDGVEGKK